jgi:hypothetical protein
VGYLRQFISLGNVDHARTATRLLLPPDRPLLVPDYTAAAASRVVAAAAGATDWCYNAMTHRVPSSATATLPDVPPSWSWDTKAAPIAAVTAMTATTGMNRTVPAGDEVPLRGVSA